MLLVLIGVGVCLSTIYSITCRYVLAYLKILYRSPSLASSDEDITVLMICAIARMAPLFGGSGGSLDTKSAPQYASSVCI